MADRQASELAPSRKKSTLALASSARHPSRCPNGDVRGGRTDLNVGVAVRAEGNASRCTVQDRIQGGGRADLGTGVYVRQVRADAGRADNVIEAQGADSGVEL
jgi:hypothetical protein